MVQRVQKLKHPQLLCCVCQEQNTAYYEVVFAKSDFSQTVIAQIPKVEDRDNDYYNFPVRHPRHGHLQWACKPETGSTYPDYPVHIRTTTLARIFAKSEKGRLFIRRDGPDK